MKAIDELVATKVMKWVRKTNGYAIGGDDFKPEPEDADDECVVQYHPPKADYVNIHPNCLHLWKPQGIELPRPPTYMVGPKSGQSVEGAVQEWKKTLGAL